MGGDLYVSEVNFSWQIVNGYLMMEQKSFSQNTIYIENLKKVYYNTIGLIVKFRNYKYDQGSFKWKVESKVIP